MGSEHCTWPGEVARLWDDATSPGQASLHQHLRLAAGGLRQAILGFAFSLLVGDGGQ